MRTRNAGTPIRLLAWIAFSLQCSSAVLRTDPGTIQPADATWTSASAFGIPAYAISEVTRLVPHAGLSNTPKVRVLASTMCEPVCAGQAPELVATVSENDVVSPRYACEHVVTCDRAPPTA